MSPSFLRKHTAFGAAVLMLALLLPFMSGCGGNRRAYAFGHVDHRGWDSGDSVVLHVDTLTAGGIYAVTLCLRISTAPPFYPFTTLDMVVNSRYRAAGRPAATFSDSLSLELTSDRGEMQGFGTSLKQFAFPVDTLRLAPGTSVTYTISHYMRLDPITGINDVGVRLDRIGGAD